MKKLQQFLFIEWHSCYRYCAKSSTFLSYQGLQAHCWFWYLNRNPLHEWSHHCWFQDHLLKFRQQDWNIEQSHAHTHAGLINWVDFMQACKYLSEDLKKPSWRVSSSHNNCAVADIKNWVHLLRNTFALISLLNHFCFSCRLIDTQELRQRHFPKAIGKWQSILWQSS